jgi:transcriptional regulator with XRE-family HTH domain
MEVGKKLKKLREDKKMSMYRLTQITGISGHHIKGIEEGSRQPTIDTLSRLVTALGSSLSEIFNDNVESTFLSQKEKRLIDNFRTMSEEKADALLNLSTSFPILRTIERH